jgi:hypothetical protein
MKRLKMCFSGQRAPNNEGEINIWRGWGGGRSKTMLEGRVKVRIIRELIGFQPIFFSLETVFESGGLLKKIREVRC